MADYSITALGNTQISISGGAQLSGFNQGDGNHMVGETITLLSNAYETINVTDGGSDSSFGDSDGDQRLDGAQSFDGTSYADNRRVEAEYRLTVQDPDGNTYELIAFNINAPDGFSSFGTVEGLAFIGGPGEFPPIGVPLSVVANFEGPNFAVSTYATPICFAKGSLIQTPQGERRVETLRPGQLVKTRDHGSQPILWIGRTRLSKRHLAAHPEHRPIRVRKDAFGKGRPKADLSLSPQHRVLLTDWRAQLFFGEDEILVPVKKLLNDSTVVIDRNSDSVVYYHVLFAHHQIVKSNGLWSESLLPPAAASNPDPIEAYQEIIALFPELADQNQQAIRACVSGRESRLLAPA